MSILHTALIYGAIPAAVFLVVGVGAYVRGKTANPAPKPFVLGETWDRPPVLWTATDEIVAGGGHHGGGQHGGGHADVSAVPNDLIGGRARGEW